MKKGNVLVEQVMKDGTIVMDYDYSLTIKDMKERLQKHFPMLKKWNGSGFSNFYVGEYKKQKYAIRCKNITYLGNPHPKYKKRIQISNDLQSFYKTAKSIGAKPILLGIYEHDGEIIFVDFKINTYIEKKAHNSSAHIYTSDLSVTMTDGFFQKIDYFGNTITAFKSEYTSIFLDEYLTNQTGSYNQDNIDYYHKSSKNKKATYDDKTDPSFTSNQGEQDMVIATQSSSEKNLPEKYAYYLNVLKTQVIPNVEKFFDNEKKNWNGIECYKEMIADNYKNKFQPEWPGFYLEYEFEKFINDNQLNHVFNYYQDKTKGGIDLDLYFPQLDSYGDLKSHSISSNGIPGNDWDTVMSIIDEDAINSHIYYIICVSEAEKDSLYEYEVTHFWNTQQKKDNLMSYSSKMKNNVTLKKIYILDINKKNKNYLTIFRQGINSNGKPRAPKIMIDEKNLEHFIIFEKNLS